MRFIVFMILVLLALKAYTYTMLSNRTIENNEISAFIEYNLETKRLSILLKGQKREMLDLSKSSKALFHATEELLDNSETENPAFPNVLIEVFNNSSLREILQFQSIEYLENPSLSAEHNMMIVSKIGYGVIIEKMLSDYKPIYYDQPYLFSLERNMDSMDVVVGLAMGGPVQGAQLVYKGDTIPVDKLPINIGPIKGDVAFILTNAHNDEKRCFKKRF